ncbi:MAG: hypothetical protein ACRD4G_09255 [Bryobacteraceae bacterium]
MAVSNGWTPRARLLAACAVVGLACLRFAHIHLLWADENYHLAASIFILHGEVPYRDFWYDKPPLDALYYLICGGYASWPLRILDAAYIVAACALIWRFARVWWGEAEAWAAALFLAFFTAFYLPSGIIPFSPDALTMLPEIAAVYCAYRRRAFWAGVWAAIAFFANPKALFVLAVCAVWLFPQLPMLAAGFVIPVAIGFGWLAALGAWSGYVEQVWHWGFIYARNSPQPDPFETGVRTTLDWLGFQAALAVAAIYAFLRLRHDARWRLGVWLVFSFAAVCLGLRFAPHYYLQFLPALVFVAARGTICALREHKRPGLTILILLLLMPAVRFGPRYALLTLDNIHHREPRWNDVILDLDSRQVATKIRTFQHPGDTLFVWGYRPSMYVYTRMVPPGLFWDSQPLTGVPADRHLHATTVVYGGAAARNRELLIHTHPTFIVDGLGLLNPRLAPSAYPEVRAWLAHYRLVARTKLSLIYQRSGEARHSPRNPLP